MLLVFSGARPAMLLHILQHIGQSPQQRVIWSKRSVVLRVRSPAQALGLQQGTRQHAWSSVGERGQIMHKQLVNGHKSVVAKCQGEK